MSRKIFDRHNRFRVYLSSKNAIIRYMKVNIYLNDERIENEDVKKYKCVSAVVKDAVNEAYYRYLDEQTKSRGGKNVR